MDEMLYDRLIKSTPIFILFKVLLQLILKMSCFLYIKIQLEK